MHAPASPLHPCSKDRERAPEAVPPGVHGLTNGHIDAHDVHWPKAGIFLCCLALLPREAWHRDS